MHVWKSILEEWDDEGKRRWLKQERFQEAGKKDLDRKWDKCSNDAYYVTTT